MKKYSPQEVFNMGMTSTEEYVKYSEVRELEVENARLKEQLEKYKKFKADVIEIDYLKKEFVEKHFKDKE